MVARGKIVKSFQPLLLSDPSKTPIVGSSASELAAPPYSDYAAWSSSRKLLKGLIMGFPQSCKYKVLYIFSGKNLA